MIYIHAIGIHNTFPISKQQDPARELKTLSGRVYRRTDRFIQLAILGAHKAVNGCTLPEQTAIYITSGLGNISVFARICAQRLLRQQLPRPVDFINLQSNSAGFYVAAHLGLNGKNLFLTQYPFPVQMTMLAAQNDMMLKKQNRILIGGVDESIPKQDLAGKLLKVDKTTVLGEGSNWMLTGTEADSALGTFTMIPEKLNRSQLYKVLSTADEGTCLAFSKRFSDREILEIMSLHPKCTRYCYEESCGYYETLPLYVLNRFLAKKKGGLIHIDVSEDHFMIMMVDNSAVEPALK